MTEQEYAKVIAKNLKRLAYDQGKSQVEIARDLLSLYGKTKRNIEKQNFGIRMAHANKKKPRFLRRGIPKGGQHAPPIRWALFV